MGTAEAEKVAAAAEKSASAAEKVAGEEKRWEWGRGFLGSAESIGTVRVERVGRGGLGLCGLATAAPPRVLKNGAKEATAQENRRL